MSVEITIVAGLLSAWDTSFLARIFVSRHVITGAIIYVFTSTTLIVFSENQLW